MLIFDQKMFNSKYTKKTVGWRHRIIELLCENKARIDNKLPLPPAFWNQKPWKQYWAYQASLIKPIIEHVDYISIYKAIVETKTSSLKNKRFKIRCWEIFKASQNKPQVQIEPSAEKSLGSFKKKETNLDLL